MAEDAVMTGDTASGSASGTASSKASGTAASKVSGTAASRASTGIGRLDRLLSGGFAPGSIILLIGEPGTGKTTIVRKFVCEGLEKGANAIYLMTNRSLDHVLTSMERFGCNVTDNQNMKFLMYNGVAAKRYPCFVGNFDDLIDVAYNCERIISSMPPGSARMVIDDFSYLFLVNSKEVVFKFLNRMIQILRQNETTCIIEVQKGMLDPQIVTALESLTDGTVETQRQGDKKSLRISRMEDEDVKSEWINFDISPLLSTGADAERTLDDWEKVLKESDVGTEEQRVAGMLKDIRERKKSSKSHRRLFHMKKK